jgi:hypothetical protein
MEAWQPLPPTYQLPLSEGVGIVQVLLQGQAGRDEVGTQFHPAGTDNKFTARHGGATKSCLNSGITDPLHQGHGFTVNFKKHTDPKTK